MSYLLGLDAPGLSIVACPMPEIRTYRTLRDKVDEAANILELSYDELTGPGRDYRRAHARQAVMLAMHETGRYTLPEIGRALHRDHTTVMHGIKRARERRDAREDWQAADMRLKKIWGR